MQKTVSFKVGNAICLAAAFVALGVFVGVQFEKKTKEQEAPEPMNQMLTPPEKIPENSKQQNVPANPVELKSKPLAKRNTKDLCEFDGAEEPYLIKKNGLIIEKGLTFEAALEVSVKLEGNGFCSFKAEKCDVIKAATYHYLSRAGYPFRGGLTLDQGITLLGRLKKLGFCD